MARDAEEGSNDTVAWMIVVEDNMAEISNLSKLLALQMLLEKVEVQSRRVVANELKAFVDDSGYGASDDLGRQSLRQTCKHFHEASAKIARGEELQELEWRA